LVLETKERERLSVDDVARKFALSQRTVFRILRRASDGELEPASAGGTKGAGAASSLSRNLDFYSGLQWQGRPRRGERRLTFNYVKVLLEKVTSYLSSGTSFTIEPLEPSEEGRRRAREAEVAVRQINEDNDLEELDLETELDASVLGDGCYKVTWDPKAERVRVTSPDVQGVHAWWVGDDPSNVWRVASGYRISAEDAESLYNLTPEGRDKEVTVLEGWTDSLFQLWVGKQLLEERPNPYGFIPFIIFPNLREPKKFWGISDVPVLVEPARELNRALSQLSTILELSGNPIAVLEGVEEARDIAVEPGAVWELPEKARAYLLDLLQGGGVKLHTDYIELIYKALHDLSEAPRVSFGDNPQSLSGVALEMEMHPLLQRVHRKRLIRASVYRRRAEMMLRILEQRRGVSFGPLWVRVQWGPVLPQDRSRLVQQERTLVEAGLHSRRRAMEELGVADPEGEMSQIQQEAAEVTGVAMGRNGRE